MGYSNKAWRLATCPAEQVRDGKRAVEAGKRACELTDYKSGDQLENLAAAYAEAGDFTEAVKWQKRRWQIPITPRRPATTAQKRLKLYEDHKPYREDK